MKNKTILITGASRGLGWALSRHWQRDNVVIGVARHRPIKDDHNGTFYKCDLGDEQQVEAMLKKLFQEFKQIDVVINNAAVLSSVPLGIMQSKDISAMINVNMKAPILISKAVFRKMIQSRSGQIINILSMAPRLSVVGDSVYAATKSGLEAFSKVLNKEGHPFGVHVNNIGLSAFESGMLEQIVGKQPEKILGLIPHGQFAPFREIVAAIEFFVENSTDIGGQTLYFGGV